VKLEQLQSAWQAHHQNTATSKPSSFPTETITKSVKFEATLWRRDWIETCAAVFVIVMFGSTLFTDDLGVLSIVGVLIIMTSTLCIIWVLHSSRRRQTSISHDDSLAAFAREELHRVETQIALLRNVTLWYTTPLTIGAVVFVFGLLEPWWVALIGAGGFLIIFALVGLVIHHMNQQCIKNSLVPLQQQLLDLIRSLETPSEN
jgi:hypothetical protein